MLSLVLENIRKKLISWKKTQGSINILAFNKKRSFKELCNLMLKTLYLTKISLRRNSEYCFDLLTNIIRKGYAI